MKATGANVILLWLVLHCVHTTPQSSCVQENSCESFTKRHYCKLKDGATAGGYDKPVCSVIEVQPGNPKFKTIYLHCCDKENNITSRKWFFTPDLKMWKPLNFTNDKSWKPLDVTNETISIVNIRDYRMGFYRCITEHSNKITDERTIQVNGTKCTLGYDEPEVKFPNDVFVKIGQPFTKSFYVDFGCEATARNISIQFYKDGIPKKTSNAQGCTSDRKICLPEVTQDDIGMKVSITVTACYGGKLQEVMGSFSILNEVQTRQVASLDYIEMFAVPCGSVFLVILICIFYCQKCHIWILSRMSFPGRLIDKGKVKKVCILHCDDDTTCANNVREWIAREYTLLSVVCSCDSKGTGVLTGEFDAIQESDYVIFIPSSSTADKVNENVFNSIVQHKDYSRITILDFCASQTRTCSLSKNKIFKCLKHINLKSCLYEDINRSGLRNRLPICAPRRNSCDMGHICCQCSTSRDLYGYQTRYQKLDNYIYRFLGVGGLSNGRSGDCNKCLEKTSQEECGSDNPIINTQQSQRALQNSLKLFVPTGSCSEKEVTSLCNAESPDTATTFLSPDIECNTIPFDNIDVNKL
ncbi:uncharacterized protein LOC110454715 [Mizuhopecten yessoensis]|uniref:Ig-like domain-containing protein n=1 Tax=Mizuhopecten yessoensis TaxID=6573 RepID=A0A210QEN8_MIZYE|nr:uncharacterized protein LOC110454715 [Mizuhopecten yessoensis]OWF47195.1 hypothetical protein KP79_PYT20392 [Mizuhopecten yessoensis]